mmetsp:Transcript_18021/g.54265  ORF Transcript_18021/g.54265 Transcript_18021/m.54265 type:complete len:324 (+) Transcript_18021:1085-2056(+)
MSSQRACRWGIAASASTMRFLDRSLQPSKKKVRLRHRSLVSVVTRSSALSAPEARALALSCSRVRRVRRCRAATVEVLMNPPSLETWLGDTSCEKSFKSGRARATTCIAPGGICDWSHRRHVSPVQAVSASRCRPSPNVAAAAAAPGASTGCTPLRATASACNRGSAATAARAASDRGSSCTMDSARSPVSDAICHRLQSKTKLLERSRAVRPRRKEAPVTSSSDWLYRPVRGSRRDSSRGHFFSTPTSCTAEATSWRRVKCVTLVSCCSTGTDRPKWAASVDASRRSNWGAARKAITSSRTLLGISPRGSWRGSFRDRRAVR